MKRLIKFFARITGVEQEIRKDTVAVRKIEALEQRQETGHNDTLVMWRSVEDKMPDDFVGVLAADKHGRIYLVEFDGGNFIQTAEGEYAYDITHWASLPEPPKST